ncbi:polymeric immunoglobulin receptor-like isoform X1 [Anarrhichthys ocellatus]|uniref:polymeric immunoglobulin receptor-like isoform X1 n=1 Tax=Anarrhichthys ocellatus TaxID=433405 RepID=UPI0012EE5CE2|nr:polymeric immunoglobulin receptor-like isoform X1 [Anarrhichthys ocellatus]
MIFPFVSHLILAGLMGIHSQIVTVSEVSVKAGGSISIPCLYELTYKNNVKYLCKGQFFLSCSVITNERFSISDDTNKGIFTVTINDLRDEDTSSYYCAVKIIKKFDVKERFQLSVTTSGMPSLYVDQQEISTFDRGSVTVRCHSEYAEGAQWCRLSILGRPCATGPTGSIDGTAVTINSSVPNVFTVTMSKLRIESSGWYLCVNGQSEMPVHVTVHELPSTTSTTISPTTARPSPTTTQYSSLRTSAAPHPAHPTNSSINGTGGESLQEHKSSTKVTILTTTLVLLLLVVPAAFFGWRMMMKRRNKNKPEGSAITAGSQIGSDPDVHYTTIVHTQHAAAQQQQKDIPEESVTYSTIVLKDSVRQMIEPVDGSVIYSTLHTKTE